MKAVALMVPAHLEGFLAWVTSRQTNGFLEAINGLFQAAKRKARGYGRFRTIGMIIFLIAGKLDFSRINPYAAAEPTRFSTEPELSYSISNVFIGIYGEPEFAATERPIACTSNLCPRCAPKGKIGLGQGADAR